MVNRKILGSSFKFVSNSEAKNKNLLEINQQKKIKRNLVKKLTLLRPAGGKSPYLWDQLIGKKSKKYNEFEKR